MKNYFPPITACYLALSIFIVQLAFMEWSLHPAAVTRLPPSYYQYDEACSFVWPAFKMIRFKADWRKEPLKVILLGGSSIRELTPPDEVMSERLSRAVGEEVVFLNLGTPRQMALTNTQLAQVLPKDERTLFILGMTIHRYSDCHKTENHFKVPLVFSDPVFETGDPLPDRLPGYVPRLYKERRYIAQYINARFSRPLVQGLTDSLDALSPRPFLAAIRDSLWLTPMDPYRYHEKRSDLFPVSWYHTMDQKMIPLRQGFDANRTLVESQLQAFSDYVRQQGCGFALLFGPLSPYGISMYGNYRNEIRTSLRALAEKNQGALIDTSTLKGNDNRFFFDLHHCNDEGRERWTDPLVGRIARLLKKRSPRTGKD